MNFAIYCRKSKYTGKGESIETQEQYCKKYIDFYFPDVQHHIETYSDVGYSGKTLDRPSFKNLLDDCQNHTIDFVIVYRLDRVSRNVSDFANLYQTLTDLGIGFISATEKYDTSTSGGRAMLFMACVFAQLERETVSERVRDSMYSLAQSGRWLGGNLPTGYTSVESTQNGKIHYKLHPTDDIKLVELIYKKYLESLSLSTLESHLYACGITSPNSKRYTKSSLRGILENPTYCQSDSVSYEYLKSLGCKMFCNPHECNHNGYLVYGRTSTDGKTQKRTTPNDWVVSIGEHSGVISGEEWVSVQRALHRNESSRRTIHHEESLLSGMLHCPNCHHKMFTRTKTHGYVYSCSQKLQFGTKACSSPNVDGSIDSLLIENLLSVTPPNTEVIPQLESFKSGLGHTAIELEKSILLKRANHSKRLLHHVAPDSLTFKEVSQEHEQILLALQSLESSNHLDTSTIDLKTLLMDGFYSLPKNSRRKFLEEIICTVEIK